MVSQQFQLVQAIEADGVFVIEVVTGEIEVRHGANWAQRRAMTVVAAKERDDLMPLWIACRVCPTCRISQNNIERCAPLIVSDVDLRPCLYKNSRHLPGAQPSAFVHRPEPPP